MRQEVILLSNHYIACVWFFIGSSTQDTEAGRSFRGSAPVVDLSDMSWTFVWRFVFLLDGLNAGSVNAGLCGITPGKEILYPKALLKMIFLFPRIC